MVSQELDRTGPSETGFSWQRKEGLESLGPAGVTLSKACCRNQRPNGLFQNVFTWTGVGILGKGGKGEAHRAGRSSTGSPPRGRGQQKWPPLPRRLLWAKSWAWSPRAVPWGKHQGRLGTWSSVMTLEEGLRPKEPGRSGAQPSLLWPAGANTRAGHGLEEPLCGLCASWMPQSHYKTWALHEQPPPASASLLSGQALVPAESGHGESLIRARDQSFCS